MFQKSWCVLYQFVFVGRGSENSPFLFWRTEKLELYIHHHGNPLMVNPWKEICQGSLLSVVSIPFSIMIFFLLCIRCIEPLILWLSLFEMHTILYQFQSCFNLIQNVLLQRRSFDELSFVKERVTPPKCLPLITCTKCIVLH